MPDQKDEGTSDRCWRRLGVFGSFVDAAARLAELLARC